MNFVGHHLGSLFSTILFAIVKTETFFGLNSLDLIDIIARATTGRYHYHQCNGNKQDSGDLLHADGCNTKSTRARNEEKAVFILLRHLFVL